MPIRVDEADLERRYHDRASNTGVVLITLIAVVGITKGRRVLERPSDLSCSEQIVFPEFRKTKLGEVDAIVIDFIFDHAVVALY